MSEMGPIANVTATLDLKILELKISTFATDAFMEKDLLTMKPLS